MQITALFLLRTSTQGRFDRLEMWTVAKKVQGYAVNTVLHTMETTEYKIIGSDYEESPSPANCFDGTCNSAKC